MLLQSLSLAARRIRPSSLTAYRSPVRFYSQHPTSQKAMVTVSFDDHTNSVLKDVESVMSPWLQLSSDEAKLFDIILDNKSPEVQAERIQNIAGRLQQFEIGPVITRLECPDLLLRFARTKDWNGYYGILYEKFRKYGLVPSNYSPRGPDIKFLCTIAEKDRFEISMRLAEQFPKDIHLGFVTKLNIYKHQDGQRQKSTFDIGAQNSILDPADPFSWGQPIPAPIPIGAMGAAGVGSAMQSPPGTEENDSISSNVEDGEPVSEGDGDRDGSIDGITEDIDETF